MIAGFFAAGEHLGGAVERRLVAGAARRHAVLLGLEDLAVDLLVEVVARDVDLHRAVLGQRDAEGGAERLGHPVGARHLHLVLGDRPEDRKLVDLLKAVKTAARGHGRRSDDHDRRVRVIRGGDRRDDVGDAGTVLARAHARDAGHARIAVGHVAGGLLVADGDEADARGREEVERVHERRTDDAEDLLDAFGPQGLDHGFAGGHVCHGYQLLVVRTTRRRGRAEAASSGGRGQPCRGEHIAPLTPAPLTSCRSGR